VSVTQAPLQAHLYLMTTGATGDRHRLDATAAPAPLNLGDWTQIAATLTAGNWSSLPQLMLQEDAFYFGHHRDIARLPVYRIVSRDASGTRFYLDPVSGELISKIDRAAKAYRWWHQGLHRMDFVALMRARPQWDVLMLILISGVTGLCVSGAYLGYRRLVNPPER
jgi:hypothetical protein